MQSIYIGVDFHARQQTICYLTTELVSLSPADAALPTEADQDSYHEQKQFADLGATSWGG